jgi:hypothetical protein
MRPLSGRQEIAKVTAGPDTFYVGLLGQHQTVLAMADPGAIRTKRFNPYDVGCD